MLFVGQAGSGKTNLMVSILSQHKKKGKRCGMAKVIIVFAILKK
jgi:DNA replication protein DnaC